MKRLSLALTAALMASPAFAVDTVDYIFQVPAEGILSMGDTFDPSNVVRSLNIGAGSTVIGFGWNVRLTAYAGSWLQEMQVVVSPSLTTPGWENNRSYLLPTTGNEDSASSGTEIYSTSGSIIDIEDLDGSRFAVGDDGELRMEFIDSPDDLEDLPDGKWRSGTLTIRTLPAMVVPPLPVPEPGTYGLMALGLLGVAAAARRRKG